MTLEGILPASLVFGSHVIWQASLLMLLKFMTSSRPNFLNRSQRTVQCYMAGFATGNTRVARIYHALNS